MKAQGGSFPRLTFGAEWSYAAVFYSGDHYNFFAPEGYRVDTRSYGFGFDSNAEASLHIGWNFSHRLNLSAHVGVSAVKDYHHTLPVSLRLTRHFGPDPMKDRWFGFIGLGSGISLKKCPQEILTGRFGGGYRLSLSRDTKLDFLISLCTTLTHPEIEYVDTTIPRADINRNNAYVSAMTFGIGLTF